MDLNPCQPRRESGEGLDQSFCFRRMKMGALINLTGRKLGRLTVIRRLENQGQFVVWECVCECGNTHVAKSRDLLNGDTKSCGCLQPDTVRAAMTTHGHTTGGTTSTEYHSYTGMLARCYNPSHKNYYRYGGRGITVCARWLESFENFINDMGPKPKGYSLDRLDNDQGYAPENCEWRTAKQQCRNTRRNIFLTLDGVTKCLSEWSEYLGINYGTLQSRYLKGWSDEKVLTAPIGRWA